MNWRKFFRLSIVIFSSLVLASTALAGGLPEQWTEVNPADYNYTYQGLEPSCSGAPGTDDEFTFFVKGGKRNNIVIFFDGGGACWDTMNCLYYSTYTEEQTEELWQFSEDMAGMGIFDQTKKDNPFRDWGYVFIPYCTGDLHWGAKDTVYPDYQDQISGVDSWTIKHRGFVNFQAVLEYLKNNTNYPGKIFVTGSSAGSYGATLAFPYIKEAFQWSNSYLLGDAGNGVLGGTFPTEGIVNWNVQMPDWIFPDGYSSELTIADIYTAIAAEYPWKQFAQYTTAFDATQIFFYNVMLNINEPWEWENVTQEVALTWHVMMRNYAYTTAADSPNYRYYIAEGKDHTVLAYDKFYDEDSAGLPLTEWIKRMLKNQNKWENLECEECLP